MTAEQGQKAYESWAASAGKDPHQSQTWTEWLKSGYASQYEKWMPWIEAQYLKWFTDDNKASYAAKDTLDKSKVTGVEQVDNLQDGVNNLVAGQVGKGGLLQPAGDAMSKEGIDRAERGGRDDKGGYGMGGYADSAVEGVKSGGQGLVDGVKGVGGYVPGFGGKGGDEKGEKK